MIGLRENRKMPFELGFDTIRESEVDVLEFVYGELRGNTSEDNACEVRSDAADLAGFGSRRRTRVEKRECALTKKKFSYSVAERGQAVEKTLGPTEERAPHYPKQSVRQNTTTANGHG